MNLFLTKCDMNDHFDFYAVPTCKIKKIRQKLPITNNKKITNKYEDIWIIISCIRWSARRKEGTGQILTKSEIMRQPTPWLPAHALLHKWTNEYSTNTWLYGYY